MGFNKAQENSGVWLENLPDYVDAHYSSAYSCNGLTLNRLLCDCSCGCSDC